MEIHFIKPLYGNIIVESVEETELTRLRLKIARSFPPPLVFVAINGFIFAVDRNLFLISFAARFIRRPRRRREINAGFAYVEKYEFLVEVNSPGDQGNISRAVAKITPNPRLRIRPRKTHATSPI